MWTVNFGANLPLAYMALILLIQSYFKGGIMKSLKFLACALILQVTGFSRASTLGDEFIRLGQKINSTSLSSDQIQNLGLKLDEAQSILSGGNGTGRFICIQGTVTGPNNQSIWSGDAHACSNPNKVYIHGDYACVTGTLYNARGSLKWTGDSNSCGDRTKIKIGQRYACAVGTIYGPGGFEKWTGDSNYCANAVLE